jgi:A/G-specific adenine glycosylase
MLQQTRVETVIPYFERWMHMFPNVYVLAGASERDVLNAWEGLGYYSRARNLHRAAKKVVNEHGGELPRDLDLLLKLPGIGRYTVGAIASIAFGMDAPTLDGNIRRVYARLFDVQESVDSPKGLRIFWKLAEDYLPKGQAGDYNQALMDLGAMVCLPKNPRCSVCPLSKMCKARKNGKQEQRPVKKPKRRVPHYVHAAGVIVAQIGGSRRKVLLARRPSRGLLGGMWEFPNGRVEHDPAEELARALKSGYSLRLRAKRRVQRDAIGVFQHAYTHFRVTVHAFYCETVSVPEGAMLKWVALRDLDDYPMGRVDRLIAQAIMK